MKCTIDLAADGQFAVTIPSTREDQSHTITVPASAAGITILRKILAERQRATRKEIGNDASPVQAQVEAWLAAERRELAKPKAPALDISTLNLDELDL